MDTIGLEIRISPIRDAQKPVQGIVDINYHMRHKFARTIEIYPNAM